METPEIERELDELEGRMDRLRALYEQYFLGIEKLEPQIPRKEVERRMGILRREQIRNTGLRFKFQMLIQRYNTLQQYWMRVTREIENGTFRRDVIRAAQRFGAKEAVTILGKRRAAKYARLAVAQEAQKRRGKPEDEATELDEGDLIEEVEEVVEVVEAPAPSAQPASRPRSPASRGPSSKRAAAVAPLAAAAQAPETAAPAPATAKSGLRRGASADPVSAIRPSPEDAKRRVAALAAEMKAQRAAAGAKNDASALDLDLDETPARGVAAGVAATKPVAASPSSQAGSQARPGPREPIAAQPAAQRGTSSLGQLGSLDSPFDDDPTTPPPRPAAPPDRDSQISAVRPTAHAAAPAPRAPGLASKPGASPVASATTPVSGARPAAAAAPRVAAPRAPVAPAASGAAPAPRPAVASAAPAAPASPPEGAIPDQRIRQIYSKYVEAKRAAQESTAGVTYDKLAAKLRAEAEKLKAAHPAKSVDYEVVLKDGKPLLKPVLR